MTEAKKARVGVLRGGEYRQRFPIEEPLSFRSPNWANELSPQSQWTVDNVERLERELTESEIYKAVRDAEKFKDGDVRGWDPNNSPFVRLWEDPHLNPIRPHVFQSTDLTEFVVFQYPTLLSCGAKGHLHGGYAAAWLDDMSGALVVTNRASNDCMTAFIKVDYKKPLRALQWLCFRMKLGEHTGRKWFVNGSIENLEGTTLTTSQALMLEIPPTHLTPLTPVKL